MATAQILTSFLASAKHHPFAIILLSLCVYLLSNRYQRKLHRIPGPWIRSVSTIPRMWSVYRNRSHEDDLALHKRYGKIVRVAPNTLSISDPKETGHIYGISTKFYKSRFYELSSVYDDEGLVPDTFVLADKEMHSRMKRNAANAYSMIGLAQMEPWLDAPTERLLRILGEHAAGQKSCDLGELLKRYAMDAVFSLTFGKDLDFLRKGDKTGMMKTLDIFTDYMAIFGQVPWTHRFLLGNATIANWFLGPASASQDEIVSLASAQVLAGRAAAETSTTPCTFLQRLLHNQRTNPSSLTDREINTHAFGNIAAGSDTTSIALRAVLIHLLQHPPAYARLCAEVRGTLSLPVTFAQANALPYLAAVVREAMRLHPSVGMLLARTVPAAGATLCGRAVAAGTDVGISPWVLHRDGGVFAEPDAFVPERWVEAEPEALRRMNRSFFAFGAGAHTCSGRWMALLEVMKLVPTLLLRFDFELVGEGRGLGFKNRWFTTQHGLEVVVMGRGG